MEQVQTALDSLNIEPRATKSILQSDKRAVVELDVKLPFVVSAEYKQTANRINDFYDFMARMLIRYSKSSLYKSASRRCRENAENNIPFKPSSLTVTYEVTFLDLETLSVAVDRYEYTGGANGVTVRSADNWSIRDAAPILRLFPRSDRGRIIRACTEAALSRQNAGTQYYFEHLPQNMRKYFRDDQSYLTPQGLAIFYQQVTISPHSEGIPVFILPR